MSHPQRDLVSAFISGASLSAAAATLLYRHYASIRRSAEHDDDQWDDDDDDSEVAAQMVASDGTAASWGPGDGPFKMIMVVNKSVKMGQGKVAAQCCHAAVACYKIAAKKCPAALRAWETQGCAKVAVKCPTEEEIYDIMTRARNADLPMYLVCDAGRTQVAAGSRTVLGLGPAPASAFEGVTSHLKLM
eukprot:CAMPEP_0194284422 /NCGR_PEP_ID=MMETSP0169-20130528/27598_1 /TAXON_ID=218684 /ORGANISM="Corethron pennatum, Strain L29A3" /LENGTH=188 /DNA_ID=CAMNT_0039030241 /DNA_START=19 /DNA_END=585 /DNA_ORIENTATION=+